MAGEPGATEIQPRVEVVPAARQQIELNRVSGAILYRGINRVVSSLPEDPNERVQKLKNNSSRGERALFSLKQFGEAFTEGGVQNPINTESSDSPLVIDRDGVSGTIVRIEGGDADTLTCVVQSADGSTRTTERISRIDVVNAQLLAEAPHLLSQFSDDERAALEMYLQSLRSGSTSLQPPAGKTVDEVIKAGATANGMLTVDDVRALIEARFPEQPNQNGTQPNSIDMEQRDRLQARTELLNALKGINILDYEQISQVMNRLGINQHHLTQQMREQAQVAAQLQAAINRDPDNSNNAGIKEAGKIAQAQALALRKAIDALGPNGAMRNYFDRIERGEVNLEGAQKFIRAVRSGDFEGFVSYMAQELNENSDDSPEDRERKRQMRESLVVLMKRGGIGGLVILSLILAAAQTVTGEAPQR